MENKLTHKKIRKLFSYNKKTGILRWKITTKNTNKGDIAGYKRKDGYIYVTVDKKKYSAHRLIWCGVYGYWPEGDIDHKDRIRHHNWLKNLREVSKTCNQRNCGIRKDNTSGIKGIRFEHNRNKWYVQISIHSKKVFLGRFKDFDEAVCHRLAAEQCLDWHGCDSYSPAYIYVKDNIQ